MMSDDYAVTVAAVIWQAARVEKALWNLMWSAAGSFPSLLDQQTQN